MVAIVETKPTAKSSQNQRLTPNIVYQANVSSNINNKKRVCLGLSETWFKERYNNHVRDGKRERYSNATDLLKYVWGRKQNNKFQ